MLTGVEAFYLAFGERVRRARQGRFSQAQLARKMRMSRGSIANIETGRQRIPLHVLLMLARELGVEPIALIPTDLSGPEDLVPPDRLRGLHALDVSAVETVMRRAREQQGGPDESR